MLSARRNNWTINSNLEPGSVSAVLSGGIVCCAGLLRRRGSRGRAEVLFENVAWTSAGLVIGPPQILTEDSKHQQLKSAQEKCDDHQGGPAQDRLTADGIPHNHSGVNQA